MANRVRQVVSRKKAMSFKFWGLQDLDLLVSKLNLKQFDVDEKDGKTFVSYLPKLKQFDASEKESAPKSITEGQYIVINDDGFKVYDEEDFKSEWKFARGE